MLTDGYSVQEQTVFLTRTSHTPSGKFLRCTPSIERRCAFVGWERFTWYIKSCSAGLFPSMDEAEGRQYFARCSVWGIVSS